MNASASRLPLMPGSAPTFDERFGRFTAGREVRWLTDLEWLRDEANPTGVAHVVVAYRILQEAADYRAVLQRLFALLEPGGHLIVVVPHAFLYERQTALPSRWNGHARRLYTPASLTGEVEEALVPNSYRVRWLGDVDEGYDYGLGVTQRPTGESDVAVVLERIEPPIWELDQMLPRRGIVLGDTPPFAFEPPHTRIEVVRSDSVDRVLIMKLDHLGDFINAVPSLQRARRYFAGAKIDLLVGSWNLDLARDLGVADRVLAFDAFPRNSSEIEPNVDATLGMFQAQVTRQYDLAIDLRVDVDTRPLLRAVRANLKAGIGRRERFPFLDIALPLDDTRNEATRPLDEHIAPNRFTIQGAGTRRHFALYSDRETVEREHPIVWGPYLHLQPGDYLFDFYIDLQPEQGSGLLRLDIALDRGRRVAEMIVSGPDTYHLRFRVDRPGTVFEARIGTVEDTPSISFGFHGGRLIRKAPGNVLHQAEYAALLVELVRMRVEEVGVLTDLAAP